jgi:hypothetical protein
MATHKDVVAHNQFRAAAVAEKLDELVAVGGGDECEDVVGALERVCSGSPSDPSYWGWSARACAKFCILVCDSPCHGSSCHPPSGNSTDLTLGRFTHYLLSQFS